MVAAGIAAHFAHHHAGQLIGQAGVGNRHGKRAEHGIGERNLRAASQAALEMGDYTFGDDFMGSRVDNIRQRQPGGQAAHKCADNQAQYNVYACRRQNQHHQHC